MSGDDELFELEMIVAQRGKRADERCPFDECDGSGFVVDESSNTAFDCRCRERRISTVRTTSLKGRIPRRYAGVSFERPPISNLPGDVVSQVRTYIRDIDAMLDAGRGLWVAGDIGTGKTSLAMLISKAAQDRGHSIAVYSLPRLLNLLRDEVSGEGTLLELHDRLASVDLLQIDDLGAQHTTPWRLEQLYAIVDARYQAEKAIVATTNLLPDELAEQMGRGTMSVMRPGDTAAAEDGSSDDSGVVAGKRIVSRLVEMCGEPLPLFGDDRRQSENARRERAELFRRAGMPDRAR